jgi:hypothetical protein
MNTGESNDRATFKVLSWATLFVVIGMTSLNYPSVRSSQARTECALDVVNLPEIKVMRKLRAG